MTDGGDSRELNLALLFERLLAEELRLLQPAHFFALGLVALCLELSELARLDQEDGSGEAASS